MTVIYGGQKYTTRQSVGKKLLADSIEYTESVSLGWVQIELQENARHTFSLGRMLI